MSEHFCYIAPYKQYVHLGFYYGADLNDPDGLLKGSGKDLRHIKIASLDELKPAAIRDIVEQASTHLPKISR
jgi:hypothetical protein